jgi:hypothetical protein
MKCVNAVAALEASLSDADAEVSYWSKEALEAAGTIEVSVGRSLPDRD